MSFIMGDGDNVAFVKGSRRGWMQDRVKKCAAGEGCFPISWTMSPACLHLAPEWIQWYYNKSYETGNDYFVLPPSGDLYSYPSEMPKES